jgi:phosphoglycerate dehydrogenase-like enzyme
MSSSSMDTALVLKQVSDSSLDTIKKAFKTVHYFPSSTEKLTDEILSKVQVIFSTYAGPPSDIIPSFEKTPELQFVQIPSAGADKAGQASAFKKQSESSKDEQRVKLCNSSGIHVTSIPQWTVAMTINLLHQIQKAIIHGHTQKTWAKKEIRGPFGEETYYARDIVGLTVGLLVSKQTGSFILPCLTDDVSR